MCNNEKCLEPSYVWVHPPNCQKSIRICQKLVGHQFEQGHFSASLTSSIDIVFEIIISYNYFLKNDF